MNCGTFLVTLEAGDAGSLGREALEHAEACEVCGRALAEARALERALEAHLAAGADAAPAGFADRLMSRVERMPQAKFEPADVARATLAAFASPPIAASLAGAAVLLGFAAANGFDPARLGAATAAAAAPIAHLLDRVTSPLPSTGLAGGLASAGVLLAGLPLLALLVAAAWQAGAAIAGRTARTL